MLGKLTRWLRIMGQDVVSVNDYDLGSGEEDDFLLDFANDEGRVLLTRDVDLHREALKRSIRSVLLEDEEMGPVEQVNLISKKLGQSFGIDSGDSRCPVCNGELENVSSGDVSDVVPEPVVEENEEFWKCLNCEKVYWRGGHWENIEKKEEKLRDKDD